MKSERTIGIRDIDYIPQGYFIGRREEMIKYVPSGAKRMLEVGCGAGDFGELVKQSFGQEVWGVEINKPAAALAESKLDRVLVGDVCQSLDQLPDCYFDSIFFNDVLEHLYDPYKVLQAAKAKLVEGGVVVCSVPNIRYYRHLTDLLFRKQWRYEDSGVMDKTHIRFFTGRSIQDTFNQLGYRVIRLDPMHVCRKVRIRLLSWITLGWLSDILNRQFVCVATPDGEIS